MVFVLTAVRSRHWYYSSPRWELNPPATQEELAQFRFVRSNDGLIAPEKNNGKYGWYRGDRTYQTTNEAMNWVRMWITIDRDKKTNSLRTWEVVK